MSKEYRKEDQNGRANTEEIRRFWRHLYGKGKGFLCIATADRVGDELEDVRHEYFPYPAESKGAAEHVRRESERGREVYHTTHLLTKRRRVKGSAAQVLALWADLDGAPVPEDPKPTAVIESSPGHFHAYWLLSKPLAPEQAETINRRLAYAIEGDRSKWALTTLLRPPHTTNYKRAEPTPVTLLGLEGGREWDPDEIAATLPEGPSSDGHGTNGSEARTGEPPVRLGRSALPIWRGEDVIRKATGEIDRSRSLHRIGGVLARGRAAEGAIVAALRERDETLGWRKYTGRADADKRYSDIAAGVIADAEAKLGPTPDAEANAQAAKPGPRKRGTYEASYNLTDLGNAERLIARHGADLRYVHPWNKWLVWDGTRWKPDTSGEIERRARATVRAIYAEAESASDKDERKAIARHATASESRSRIEAMIALARSMVPAAPDELDSGPWLFNTMNGTVDLRTGDLRPHRREDLITKVAPVEHVPNAEAPRFARFLREVFGGDEDLIAFVQRFAGYSLTGSTEERAFAILHGTGKNGKSTLVELLQDVMGDYARNTDTETVLRKRSAGVSNDVAALKGARFVSAAEIEQGRALAESKVKNLTGSDTVTARFLFAEPFDFRPEFKLWLSTNNKPVIHGTDDAIWDRIRLIPFTRRFAGDQADHALPRKLRDELPGVLAWMIAGCLDWQRRGLGEPEKVANATAGYRIEMDTLAAFFEDRCVIHPRAEVPATPLYKAYQEWCAESGEADESQRRFGSRLRERGFSSFTYTAGPNRDRKGWRGIGLRDERPDDGPGGGGPPPEQTVTADDQIRASAVEREQGAPDAPDAGADRPQSGQTVDNRPHGASSIGIGETREGADDADDRGRKINNPKSTSPRVGRMRKKGPQGPQGPQMGAQSRLSADEAERVQRLVHQGMSPKFARAEVLGDGAA